MSADPVLHQAVAGAADPMQAAVELLRRLVAFDTTSHRSNLALVDAVDAYLGACGIASERVYDATGTKANLYATIGPPSVAGICLSGHTDVVPANPADWISTPFALREDGGRLYGRGTADMKGFIACVLAMVPRFKDAAKTVPIHLAFSYDEEVGCVGVRGLIDRLSEASIRPAACIIGEPTRMAVAYAHKGKQAWRCVAHGKAGHSAAPAKGTNAIVPAARFISLIDREARRLEDLRDAAFEPPYSTLHVGRISGGVAVNVIPERCEFDFEIRNIPGADADATIGGLRAEASKLFPDSGIADGGCGFGFERLSTYPALQGGNVAAQAFLGWVRTLGRDGAAPRHATTLSFGSEGGLFESQLGIPVVVCGPGSIDDAHRPDEFVERTELERCCSFLEALARRIEGNELPPFFLSTG